MLPHSVCSPSPSALFTDYRRYCSARLVSTTATQRLTVAREWHRLHPDLGEPTYRDVEAWLRDRGLAAAGRRSLLVHLRGFYRYLLREGIVDRDPTALVESVKVPARLPRPAPERDVARLFRDVTEPRLRALLALMALGGLRCVECSRLDWADVDLLAGTVRADGKGRRERVIAISPDVASCLRALTVAGGRRHGAVFVGPSGQRMAPYRVSQYVNVSLHRLGYRFSAHQLRHRCATAALQVPGADLLAVRDLLGHGSVATTQIYAACIPGLAARTSRAMQIPA